MEGGIEKLLRKMKKVTGAGEQENKEDQMKKKADAGSGDVNGVVVVGDHCWAH